MYSTNTDTRSSHDAARLFCLATVLLLAPLPALSADESGLTFHLSFDQRDVNAEKAQGNAASTTFQESLELRGAEGASGPGFMLQHGERLDYEMAGNFDLRQGTVSLWVQPVNWEGDAQRFHHHFVAQCPGVFSFYLYHYTQPTHLFFYIALGKRRLIARTPAEQWRPGKWYHVVAVWDRKLMQLYVNGIPEGETMVPDDFDLPERDDGFISITPIQFWPNPTVSSADDRTLVDEVKIYNRTLSAEEVRREYVRCAGGATDDVSAKPVDMVCELDSHTRVVRLKLDAFAMSRSAGPGLTAKAQLTAADGEVITARECRLEQARGTIELPWTELAPGAYSIAVAVTSDDGKQRETLEHRFERPDTPWLQPLPAYDHAVPEPWTDVAGDGRRVEVWGRQYHFRNGPLPVQVRSQEQDLLTTPILLELDVGQGTCTPEWMSSRLAETHPDRLVREGSGSAGELQLTYRTTVEFDGMLRCDLRLAPASDGPVQVKALRLRIPLKRDHASFVHTHKLLPWDGDEVRLDFTELVWLTGHHLGFCWFAESDANWVNATAAKPIRIRRTETVTTLDIDIIDSPVTLDQPIGYTFGLQATPVRELPDNWRTLNLGPLGKIRGSTAQITAWGGGCLKQSGYLEPWRQDIMHRVCKKWRDGGSRALPYSTPTYLSDHNPVHAFYDLEWRNTSGHKYVGYKHRDGFTYAMTAVCPASDYSNMLAYWVENLSRDYDIGGIYLDCCSADRCRNTRHGCGGTDAFGRRYCTYPIFALRESLKRVFTILHSRGKILMNHAHSRFYPPCHAFSDYWYPGEQFTAALGRNLWHYCDDVPLEVWQVELSARTKGVGIAFLPEYGRGTDKRYRDEETKPSRSLLACCSVHDIPVSGSWIHLDELQKVWDVYGTFQLSAAQFHPYWETGCPVQVSKPLLASAYRRGNQLLLVVSNLTAEQREGTLRIDTQAFGIEAGAGVLRNAQTAAAIDAPLDAVPVKLAERDYVMLSLTWD